MVSGPVVIPSEARDVLSRSRDRPRGTHRRSLVASLLGTTLELLVLAAPAAFAQPAATRALVGATLVDGRGGPVVPNASVVIRDGRIACAGARTACPPPAGAEIVDVSGRWIIPGLVDAHVHYSQTGWADGRPDALDMRQRFPYDSTVAVLRDPTPFWRSYLCSGVTATFDVGGYPWTWGLREAAESSPNAPHVAAAGPLLSTRDHWLNVPGERQFLHIGSDSAVDAGARYLVLNGTSAVKVWFLARGGTADTATWRARIHRAGEHARRAGVPLIVHATNLWAAQQAVDAGAKLLVHGVSDREVDDAFIRAARAAGTIYTPTLIVGDGYRQLRARRFDADANDLRCVDPATRAKAFLTDSLPGRPDDAQLARAREQAAAGFAIDAANVIKLHRAGIPIAMGTDAGNPLTLHGPSVFLEMEALQRAGLTPMDVIVASTRNGAMAMGRLADFGTIEAGKVADLVVLTANPTADIANVRRIELVVRAGVVHQRRNLEYAPRRVSVTFDDLPVVSRNFRGSEDHQAITDRLLRAIQANRIPAVGFVNEGKLHRDGVLDQRQVDLLRRWARAGLELGNHTYSHLDLHRAPLDSFLADLTKGDDVTRKVLAEVGRAPRYFRHPFLHTGRTHEVRGAVSALLAKRGYTVAPVTIDNSDYLFAAAYDDAVARRDSAEAARIASRYVAYMDRVFAYYEAQSMSLVGREFPHVLLVHANLLNADHFDSVARAIARRGYTFAPLHEVLADSVYRLDDAYLGPAGITWLHRWALTRGVRGAAFAGEPEVPRDIAAAAARPASR
jgi:imidazolonepropionase-like amidohydrolase